MSNVIPPPTDIDKLAKWLRLLSQPKRLYLLHLVMEGLQCNCHLGEALGMPLNLVSYHLRALHQAGLVDMQRDPDDARWVYFSINPQALAVLNQAFASFFDPQRIKPLRRSCRIKESNVTTETSSKSKRTVLFLCSGNSCRSQMAEAIVNARLSDQWQAFSAGTKPTGYVHPNALRALQEIGIHHQGRSKSSDEFRDMDLDLVISVCDAAAQECPAWLGQGKHVHIGFPDPAKASGSEAEIMAVFRQVRDDIAEQVLAYLKDWQEEKVAPKTEFRLGKVG